ncbi:LacI family DNA-binding transcriptional regulator [Corynebacterium casei]|uniref:LacI family DNA-binding transcriptional regulator n=1 Tax=Corynebacterium casei TaxID=160386 RepID=UPI00264AA784|nr:LacI family DNA-binding transcriptional regulator [Corynebacterium casei]
MVKRGPVRKTLASLAAELGVSRTTVSNAYNRPDQLSPELRDRILAAAASHGYSGPDPMARSLRTRRVGSIGVVLTEDLTYAFEDAASVDFLAGMAQALAGEQSTLTLIPAGPDTAEDTGAAELLGRAVVDGFVVYSVGGDDPYLAAAGNRGLPVVVCDQPRDTGQPFVGIDDFVAIAPAAQALIDAGHTDVGILSIRLRHGRLDGSVDRENLVAAEFDTQRLRVQGALKTFADAGIDADAIPVVTRHINNRDTAREAAEELLSNNPELTAVLCTTDSMALGVMDYAEEHGISIPEELSVTGFDGIESARLRGLTTVIQPNFDKGAEAGRMLAQLIDASVANTDYPTDADGEPLRFLLETQLAPGNTVAPPRT